MALVERFGWSLYEIDRTHIESLIPFVLSAARPIRAARDKPAKRSSRVYCDQVSFL